MSLLKKDAPLTLTGKRQPPPKPQDVYYFCNACGTKFKAERADARFCCDICRSAAHGVCKNIIIVPSNLTPDDAANYDAIVIKLKDDKGTVIRTLFTNDGSGIFTRVKKELTRTGDEEKDKATEDGEQKKDELQQAASNGKKLLKNDKHLIPGKKNAKGEPVGKKKGRNG